MNSEVLLSSLQNFLQKRGIDPNRLTVKGMISVMTDWYQSERLIPGNTVAQNDMLVYRHGGWSEGCATGFNLSLLRRVRVSEDGGKDSEWVAGITLMFEPSRYGDLPPFSTNSSDWPSLEAFVHAIESSRAYKTSASSVPMGTAIEIGGLR